MNERPIERFWQDIKRKATSQGIRPFEVDRFRDRTFRALEESRAPVDYLEDTPVREATQSVVLSRLLLEHRKTCVERARRSLRRAVEQLSDTLSERLGSSDPLIVDPVRVCLVMPEGGQSDLNSLEQTRISHRKLIREVLEVPLVAHRMKLDEAMPEWLRGLAACVSTGDFRPGIRSVIEDALGNPAHASTVLENDESRDWPSWLRRTLEELRQAPGPPEGD